MVDYHGNKRSKQGNKKGNRKRDNKIIDLSRKLDQEKYKNLQKDIQIKAYKTLLDEIRELVEKNHQ